MDIKMVDAQGQEIKETPQTPLESKNSVAFPVLPEIQNNAVAEAMGLEGMEVGKYRDQMDTILEYVKSKTSNHSPSNIKSVIRSLELKLGSPPISEKRITFVSRYAYLLTQKSDIDREVKQFEKGK